MYIEKTTAQDRMIVQDIMCGPIAQMTRARRLLMEVLGEFFEDTEQKPIEKFDVEHLGDMLYAINDALWLVETEYGLTVGDETLPGVGPSYTGAERAALVREVERLRAKLPLDPIRPFDDLPDEEALPILQGLAKKGGESDGK